MKVFSKKKIKAYRNNWRIRWVIKYLLLKEDLILILKGVLNFEVELLLNNCNGSTYGNIAIKVFSFSVL